ncbi:MAG: hypothetical protein KDF65_12940 [Anaerolineae bacterium]|nr:hypothetical protein [Anaerolineae bacterium]
MLAIQEQINLAHTYAIIGQIHGLLEAWLGEFEPPVAEIFDRGDWDRLTPSQQDRILELFDQIPTQHVADTIRHAKLEEARSGIPMFEHGGSYWPVFFYQLMIANMQGKNARRILPELLRVNGSYIVLGQ